MTRARATALALVNWKGVFYERYLLDRHVTALEGANGSGKTTVMIAAYVVLLPDMTRLRFTNLGESVSTGGDRGVWGRLGEGGRPSYSVLEIEQGDGVRLIAGVQLERKGEPSLELSPFIVSGLDLRGRLQELLLVSDGEHDQIPDLKDIRKNVARLGGRLEVFPSVREYFAALFERGVTPLRLTTDEDRNKYNEMLRTSMTGGISRALTSELRSFLLKEETGLADTLGRMRKNLDACHRTRTEVIEARRLETEISGVLSAGTAMFSCAALATRARAAELSRRALDGEAAQDAASRAAQEAEQSLARALLEQDDTRRRASEAREACSRAIAERDRRVRARQLRDRLATYEGDLVVCEERAGVARAQYEKATEQRNARRADLERARATYDRAAFGLADLQSGLEELHRRAHAYRSVKRRIQDALLALDRLKESGRGGDRLSALAVLPDKVASADASMVHAAIQAAAECAKVRLETVDAARVRLDREAEHVSTMGEDRRRAIAALSRVVDRLDESQPYEQARSVLMRAMELSVLAKRTPDLVRERDEAAKLAERQKGVRARALSCGVDAGRENSIARVESRLRQLEADTQLAEEEMRVLALEIAREEQIALLALERIALLETRIPAFLERRGMVERLEADLGAPLGTASELASGRDRYFEQRTDWRARLLDLESRRDLLSAEKSALEASGGAFDADLLRMRDELDGELLAGRFEELDIEQAARRQAQLGALADAILVDDAGTAGRRLLGRPRELQTVWVVQADAGLPGQDESSSVTSEDGRDLLVHTPQGVRLTRLPERPTLGRRARERRVVELGAELEKVTEELGRGKERLQTLERCCREVDALVVGQSAWESGDPAVEIHEKRESASQARERKAEAARRRNVVAKRIADLRPQIDALRPLLFEAYLLEVPDYDVRVQELGSLLDCSRGAENELLRSVQDRGTLEELLDALRCPEPDIEEATLRQAERTALDLERDDLFRAAEALSEVAKTGEALAWIDADQALTQKQEVIPSLQSQHASARQTMSSAEQLLLTAEKSWEAAALVWQRADAERQTLLSYCERLRAEAAREGVANATDESLAEASRAVERLESEGTLSAKRETACAAEIAVQTERTKEAKRALASFTAARSSNHGEAQEAEQRWMDLRNQAAASGLRLSDEGAPLGEVASGGGSIDRWPEAQSRAELLVDRLRAARGGDDIAEEIRTTLRGNPSRPEQSYLRAFCLAREWLAKRLPAQVAQDVEPAEAVERLRVQLAALEGRLGHQEKDLRGASEDVARGIEVQLRRASAQIRRLNQQLDGVRFGSIVGIRVQIRRVERMQQVLGALREGAVQDLLFQPTLPIEEALDEIFRRYGGGRTGGQKILDYREYIDLGVEVKRHVEKDWEVASPTRLSTGEAIGVGAALMMVVLTEWERDATLLRAKRPSGSLRFLFLDEANRLSQDNLGVLFELCQNLDLQLLIAAPEVARAEGNTTYRLVRRIGKDGREEVLVSGRRSAQQEDSASFVLGPSSGDDRPLDGKTTPPPLDRGTALVSEDALVLDQGRRATDPAPAITGETLSLPLGQGPRTKHQGPD